MSQKERVRENQRPYLKCVRHIHNFAFDLVCLLPWAVCVRKSLKSNCFEDVALNVDTNKTQNSELLLSAADFDFCLGTHDVPLCVPSSVAKIDITNRYLF